MTDANRDVGQDSDKSRRPDGPWMSTLRLVSRLPSASSKARSSFRRLLIRAFLLYLAALYAAMVATHGVLLWREPDIGPYPVWALAISGGFLVSLVLGVFRPLIGSVLAALVTPFALALQAQPVPSAARPFGLVDVVLPLVVLAVAAIVARVWLGRHAE